MNYLIAFVFSTALIKLVLDPAARRVGLWRFLNIAEEPVSWVGAAGMSILLVGVSTLAYFSV